MKRFWDKVDKRGPDECWEWKASRKPDGYARFRFEGTMTTGHRVAWVMTRGPIPNRLWVLHSCDNPQCCNPKHLFLGTQAQNMEDMRNKGRRLGKGCGKRNGRHTMPERTARGSRHGMAKLTSGRVEWARLARAHGKYPSAIASALGVAVTTIYRALNGSTWGHL